MLNGFSDLEALDLSVQFDLPDFFGNCDNLINFDTPAWVDKVIRMGLTRHLRYAGLFKFQI